MTLRRLAWFLPLPFLCALGAWASVEVADRAGTAIARALSAVAAFVVSAERKEPEPESFDPESFDDFLPFDGMVPVSFAAPSPPAAKKGAAQRGAKGKATERVLFVSAATVLRLAESRARPRGVAVKAGGARPAGLRLGGVAGLGVGLQDGDVLTRAVGQPALSSSAVVQAVLVARSQRARVLEGEFWRGGERWLLQVEQPYLSSGPRVRLSSP